ncbi:Lrp/AsnC family transcriptional regulator [Segeticoccus rhizosphaerae]|jgi:DNA-binding Lrp family transcriptional regulator|nr:Lrp/AsnC family transcriptional regulator [Ornithinicoccus soli]
MRHSRQERVLIILIPTRSFRQVQISDTLYALDRQIIAALQVNARASFPAIASALREQERTVARRAQRLLDTGAVRLTAFVDELKTGLGQPVSLRISVRPGSTDAVADALSARPDTRAVMAVTGDADICCELVAADKPTLHRVLNTDLPAITGLRHTRTYAVLHHVKPTSAWQLPVLTSAQTRLLRRPRARSQDGGRLQLSSDDLELLEALRGNARCSYVDLAGQLGVTATTVRRRLDRMLTSGAVSLRASVEPELLGLRIEADVWLRVRPDSIAKTAAQLARRSEVTYCGVVTGSYGLELILALPDLDQLHSFIADVIAAQPAVLDSEPTLVTRTYKRGYLRTS